MERLRATNPIELSRVDVKAKDEERSDRTVDRKGICYDHDKETALLGSADVDFIEVVVEEGLTWCYAAMMV